MKRGDLDKAVYSIYKDLLTKEWFTNLIEESKWFYVRLRIHPALNRMVSESDVKQAYERAKERVCEECKPKNQLPFEDPIWGKPIGRLFAPPSAKTMELRIRDPLDYAKKNAKTYIAVARAFAQLVKYDGTKVGCVLVKHGNMISHGINGYPKGVDDEMVNKLHREERLMLAIHAEENALLKLMETGQSPEHAVAYVTHYPCIKCAARLYSVGIRVIVMPRQDKEFMANWITPNSKVYSNLVGMTFLELEIE